MFWGVVQSIDALIISLVSSAIRRLHESVYCGSGDHDILRLVALPPLPGVGGDAVYTAARLLFFCLLLFRLKRSATPRVHFSPTFWRCVVSTSFVKFLKVTSRLSISLSQVDPILTFLSSPISKAKVCAHFAHIHTIEEIIIRPGYTISIGIFVEMVDIANTRIFSPHRGEIEKAVCFRKRGFQWRD